MNDMYKKLEKLADATHKLVQHLKMHMSIFNDNYMKHTGHFGVQIKNIQSAAMDLTWFDA